MQSTSQKDTSKIEFVKIDKDFFRIIFPIFEKAAPKIFEMLSGDAIGVIVPFLCAIFNCDPRNIGELIAKVEKDPDLFSKLQNFEKTHADWIEGIVYHVTNKIN